MTKTEFEDLTGREVAPEEYARICGIYAAGSLDKHTFAEGWETTGRGRIIDNLVEVLRRHEVKHLEDQNTIKQLNEKMRAAAMDIMIWAARYCSEYPRNTVLKLLSIEDLIKIELRENLPLGKEERRYIAEIMGL